MKTLYKYFFPIEIGIILIIAISGFYDPSFWIFGDIYLAFPITSFALVALLLKLIYNLYKKREVHSYLVYHILIHIVLFIPLATLFVWVIYSAINSADLITLG